MDACAATCRTDLDTVSDEALTQLNQACNNTPRKCLGYRTPAEIFATRVLHLKCDTVSAMRP